MKEISCKIKNRSHFQEQVLTYFKGVKNLIFINRNSDQVNLIGLSHKDILILDNWQFGFISYDHKNNIEQLTSHNKDYIQFPEKHFFSPELLFHIYKMEVKIQYNENIYDESAIEKMFMEIDNNVLLRNEYKKHAINIQPRICKNDYLKKVSELKKHIQQGDIYEVNFCQEFYAENAEIDPISIYLKLNEKSPTPFSCFVKYDKKYLMSASPERFIKKEEDQLISQPIKGTIKRGKDVEEDKILKEQLYNDPKERNENIMIVDLVRNDLSKIAQKDTVKVDELFGIYSFSQVHQMISTVSAKLKHDIGFNEVINATFPMGSMTGAPKLRAMELIEQYEETKRGLYSGTVGYIDTDGNYDFNVVIRSILYNEENNYLSYIVGGAITSKSDPEKEYEECLLKAKAMIEVLTD